MTGRMITALAVGCVVSAGLVLFLNAQDHTVLHFNSAHDLIVDLAGLAGGAMVPAVLVGVIVCAVFARQQPELIPRIFLTIMAATFAVAVGSTVIGGGSLTRNGRLQAAIAAYSDHRGGTVDTYNTTIKPLDIDGMAEPARLARPGGVKAALEALAKYRALTVAYYDGLDAGLQALSDQAAALNAQQHHRRRSSRLRTKVDDYVANSRTIQAQLRQTELAYLDARREALLFLQARADHWRATPNGYLWDSDADMAKAKAQRDHANGLLAHLRVLADRQQALDQDLNGPA